MPRRERSASSPARAGSPPPREESRGRGPPLRARTRRTPSAGSDAGRVLDLDGCGRSGHLHHRASSRKPATAVASSVADITRTRRSSRAASASREEGQRQVGVDAALVELVEHDGAEARTAAGSDCRRAVRMPSVATSRRVSSEYSRSNRTCHPTSPADAPALLLGDPAGDRAGGHAARLKQEDGAVGGERGRHPCRLPCSGRRHQDRRAAGAQASGPDRPRDRRSAAAPAWAAMVTEEPPPPGNLAPGRFVSLLRRRRSSWRSSCSG